MVLSGRDYMTVRASEEYCNIDTTHEPQARQVDK